MQSLSLQQLPLEKSNIVSEKKGIIFARICVDHQIKLLNLSISDILVSNNITDDSMNLVIYSLIAHK